MELRNVSIQCIHRFAVLTCALLISGSSRAQVKNPGFELVSGTQPSGWTTFGNVFLDATAPRSGARSLKMFGNFNGTSNSSAAYQNVPIKPGERISATTWAFHKSGDAIAGNNYAVLRVIYRNANNADLASSQSSSLSSGTPSNQWRFISASLPPAPIGTTHCAVFLQFFQPASTPYAAGAAIFDDVKVSVTRPGPRKPIWQDDFNGTQLNTEYWEPMIGDGSAYGIPGWGNNELQYYTGRPQNISVSNGILRIIARRENLGGRAFTSARIRTLNKVDLLYGRIEARIKVPAGQGLWSAFWMLPSTNRYGGWASGGEIDIMEILNNTTSLHNTIHYGGQWPNNTSAGSSVGRPTGFAANFHVYAIEWEPDTIRWFLDGVETYSRPSTSWFSSAAQWNQRAPFDAPFHLLLNLAVGGNWPGSPTSGTPFPAEMQVDWVRAYGPEGSVTQRTSFPIR